MNPNTGDKFTATISQHNSTGRPSETHFNGKNVTADMTGPKTVGVNPLRSTTYPMRRPSQDQPKTRHPYKNRRTK